MSDLADPTVDQDFELALLCHRKGQLKVAAPLYQAVLKRDPTRADAAHLYGLAHIGLGNLAHGIEALFLSLRIKPGAIEVEHDLGSALISAGQVERAIEQFHLVIAADSAHINAHINLGLALAATDRAIEAEGALVAALALAPDHAYAWYKLGRVRAALGDWDGALGAYEKCLHYDPEHHDARYNLGNLQLGSELFDPGWMNYEARWVRPQPGPKRPFDVPVWRGESLSGRTILVWGEQGVGEEILFASMIPDLIARAGHVLLKAIRDCRRCSRARLPVSRPSVEPIPPTLAPPAPTSMCNPPSAAWRRSCGRGSPISMPSRILRGSRQGGGDPRPLCGAGRGRENRPFLVQFGR